MPITNGVYTPLSFEDALEQVINSAPASIQFSPGNPPELVLANMFAKANELIDLDAGAVIAALMSPTGAMIDAQNPNNPRRGIKPTVGYLVLENPTDNPVVVDVDTVFTASSGQRYSIGTTTATVPAAIDEYTPGTAEVVVTAVEAGIGGNIPANRVFTAPGLDMLDITNPLPWLDGANAESDARYLQRITIEKTEYGSQANSVASEVELKKYYSAARINVNKSQASQSAPVPVPGNGYKMVIRTPNGKNATSLESAKAFEILGKRFEFVNSQSLGDDRHAVMSGTIYKSGVPQAYYYTAAQPVNSTLTAVIEVRFAENTARSERISQANDFASYFINRLMAFLSGVDGTCTIKYQDGEGTVSTPIKFAANLGDTDPIAPVFGIDTIRDLVSDAVTRNNTPQLFYSGVPVMTLVMDPEVEYEDPILMSLEEYDRQFINFYLDPLFSDNTSWFDRFAFIVPEQIDITVVQVT
jgi:hypothetical protein